MEALLQLDLKFVLLMLRSHCQVYHYFVHRVSKITPYWIIKGIPQQFMVHEVGGLTGDRFRAAVAGRPIIAGLSTNTEKQVVPVVSVSEWVNERQLLQHHINSAHFFF